MKRQRDYRNLKETEKLYDAVKLTSTQVKDYSLGNLVSVGWEHQRQAKRTRLVELKIGSKVWRGRGGDLVQIVDEMIPDSLHDNTFLRKEFRIGNLHVETMSVNTESLTDHVAKVDIDGERAILDMEELLKATRYA